MMRAVNLCLTSVLLSLLLTSNAAAERRNWVLLVAGTSGYYNYRHQADICHAYQIAHKNGIPDEQIVVMMYDDIAYSRYNPFPGTIINKPGGPNVYYGVPKDYVSLEVSSKTFYRVLQGDQEGIQSLIGRRGKVIASGPEDYIFINYVGGGSAGRINLPRYSYIWAKDLMDVIKRMHDQKKFAKLMFYVDASDSGSMFKDLPNDINVYAVTSANEDEQSYAWYCDNDRHSCLGNLFGISWMENTDTVDIHTETLQQQYEVTKERTNKSHVTQYGDTSFTSYPVDKFLAKNKVRTNVTIDQNFSLEDSSVPPDMAVIHSLESLLTSTHERHVSKRVEIKKMLQAQLWIKAQTTEVMREISSHVHGGRDVSWVLEQQADIDNWECYKNSMDRLFELCPGLEPSNNNFVNRKLRTLVNLCNNNPEHEVVVAIEATVQISPICY